VGQALREAMNPDTQNSKTEEQRKRKRPYIGDAMPSNTKNQSTSDVPRQTEKKRIPFDLNATHCASSRSIHAQVLLNAPSMLEESRIQPNSLRGVRDPMVAGLVNRKGHDTKGKGIVPLDCQSMKATTKEANKHSPESVASCKSAKSFSSDSNQLSLIEWFERDMEGAPL
ncbi:MAG: hypothetical protein SGBAC_012279, partial [Bacillariaceae sp.]